MALDTDWKLTRTFTSTSGDVRWDRLGQSGSPPVVLLHGTPFSSYVWRAAARSLTRHHQVFVWDMPGYGTSEKATGQDVSLAAQGRAFTELLSHWGLEEPLVVAHDFGGAVSLRATSCTAPATGPSPWSIPSHWHRGGPRPSGSSASTPRSSSGYAGAPRRPGA